jgi:Uma2 family endonuclease
MTTLLIQTELSPIVVQFPPATEMSLDEFYEFCRLNQELRIERTARGEVIIMPPAFSSTGNRNIKIAQQLANWAERDGTGEPFDSSAGFTLPNGATRSPDASWVRAERWNALEAEAQDAFAPLCPDFVVELRCSFRAASPTASDTLKSLQEKMQEYIENGALLGWLIDRKNQKVYVYSPNAPVEVLDHPAQVSGEPVLPGFVLDMSKIW